MSKHALLGPTTLLASGRIGREVGVNRSDRPVFVDSDGHICCEHGERAATIQSWINAERETPDTAVSRPSVCDCANLDGLLTTYDVPNENLPVHGGSLFKLCGSLGTAEITANTRPQRFVLTTHEGHELWVQPSGTIVCKQQSEDCGTTKHRYRIGAAVRGGETKDERSKNSLVSFEEGC